MRVFLIIISLVFIGPSGVTAASEAVYGLERFKIDRVYDPNARPEVLLLVSGSLKLTGGVSGNTWEMVTYVPQQTASPRSDRGHFQRIGNRLRFYSHLTFGSYTGRVVDGGKQILIDKVARDGRSQSEVWYIVR